MNSATIVSLDINWILQQMINPAIYLSNDYNIIYINKPALKLLQLKEKMVIGRQLLTICKANKIKTNLNKIDTPKNNVTIKTEWGNPITEDIITVTWKTKILADKYNTAGILLCTKTTSDHITIATMRAQTTGEKFNLKDSIKTNTESIKDYLENIIALTPGNLYWMDLDCILRGCNDNTAKLAGLKTRHDMAGKTDYDLAWHSEAAKLQKTDREIMQTGKGKTLEEVGIWQDGTRAICLTKKEPLRDKDGKIIGLLGISIDISDRKKMEQDLRKDLKKANGAKGELLEILNHELRAPINNIVGLSDLLVEENKESSEQQQDYLEIINQSAHSITPLMEYLSDYADLEANEFKPFLEEFHLPSVLEGTIRNNLDKIQYTNFNDIVINYDENLPKYFYGDSSHVYQLMDRFINNSIKFADKGILTINTKLLKQNIESNKAYFEVSVQDEGPGISKAQQTHLFDLFKNLTNHKVLKEDQSYLESGLRLSILYEIVRHLGGKMGVESLPKSGARFWFRFCLPTCSGQYFPKQKHKAWDHYKNNLNILIIDEHRKRAETRCAILGLDPEKHIALATTALSKLQLEYKKNQAYNLCLIDIGLQTKKLKTLIYNLKKEPASKQTLLILLLPPKIKNLPTLYANDKHIQAIQKPILPSELPEILAECWKHYKTHKPKILLIEDDSINQKVESLMLKKLGCEITLANNGNKGLYLATTQRYDIIFMDISLPDESGMNVTKSIKKFYLKNSPPIVAVTSYSNEIDREHFIESGMDDIISKPASIESFKRILERFMLQWDLEE